MSIAVAIRKNQHTVIATDSLVSFGSGQIPASNYQTDKMLRIGDSIIASTGWALYDNLLTAYTHQLTDTPPLNDEMAIFSFFVEFWKKMKADGCFVNDQCEEKNSPFVDLDAQFLIVNQHGIFVVASNMNVIKFDEYYAIGSGSDYALGALHALYNEPLDATTIAKRVVNAAISLDTSCGGQVNCQTIN